MVRCLGLDETRGVAHVFSTRIGDPTERELIAAAGIAAGRFFPLEQVHEATVVEVATAEDRPRADAALARCGDERVPVIRTADCVPLLLADVRGRAVAAVHAGWRGTAAGIAGRAVERLVELGIPGNALRAALGPAIGVCCYEVSHEVVASVADASGGDVGEVARGRRLDLHAANRRQLVRAGLSEDAIACAPWCTACEEELFFSYRRDGAGAGRQLACIGWGPPVAGVP